MACLNPIRAWRHKLTRSLRWSFPPDQYRALYAPNPIPCGKCRGCRLETSRQWAVRMMFESTMHKYNYFLTLSYDWIGLPKGRTLVKKHLQDFHKRLRIYYTRHFSHEGIRYYCCGEYGEKRGRPHYHGIYFNLPVYDLVLFKKSGEHSLYRSATIEKLWGHGMVLIAGVTFQSCGYVARYVTKKLDSHKRGNAVYNSDTLRFEEVEDGVVKVPEFSIMSKNPAIGLDWLRRNLDDVYAHDYVVLDGRKMKPPKYFDYCMRKWCREYEMEEYWREIVKNRLDKLSFYEDDYYDVRLPALRKIANQKFKRLIRTIEVEN